MRRVKAREGIPIAVQMDFAIRAWLKKRGVNVETVAPTKRRKSR